MKQITTPWKNSKCYTVMAGQALTPQSSAMYMLVFVYLPTQGCGRRIPHPTQWPPEQHGPQNFPHNGLTCSMIHAAQHGSLELPRGATGRLN